MKTFYFARLATAGGAIALAYITPALAADNLPIRIGWLSSLTGPLSSAGIAENQGVGFAIDQINGAGGINGCQLELLTRDTAGDPTKAVNFAQRLLFSDKAAAIIGPVNSGESLATVPIVARAGIPNIVIGTVDELTDVKKYPRAFRAINTNEQWMRAANKYAIDVLKRRKVTILGTTGYGTFREDRPVRTLQA